MKIINGEIVQDDDPRLRSRATNSATSSLPFNSANNSPFSSGRVRDVFSNSNSNSDAPAGNGTSSSVPIAQSTGNPLDQLAKILKIDDKFITIPAIPFLKISSGRVGLIYFIAVAILYMVFDYKAVLLAVAVYFMYKTSDTQPNGSNPAR